MADAVEVAIVTGLLGHLEDLTFTPVITVAWPNKPFDPPTPAKTARWLRPTVLSADTFALTVGHDGSNRHAGFLQVDVFYGLGGGDVAARRVAASIIAHFKRGTEIEKDGFTIQVTGAPSALATVKSDPWIMVPVRIPYLCFAVNPA